MENKRFEATLLVRGKNQRVIVDADEFQIASLRIPRKSIRKAFAIPATNSSKSVVRVEYNVATHVDMEIDHDAQRDQLLTALGYGDSQTVVQFSTRPFFSLPASLLFMCALVLLAALAAWSRPFGVVSFFALFGFVVVYSTSKSDASVGSDGVFVARLGYKRFISRSEIVSATAFYGGRRRLMERGCGVRVLLRSGETVTLSMWEKDGAVALASRISEDIKVAKNSEIATMEALEKRQQPTRDWIRRLKTWGAGAEASFRHASVDLNRLWEVLESHSASPHDRAAAAVALSASDEPNVKVRIGAIAAATAEPKLRGAIEAVNGDDAALEEAMDALANEKEVRRSAQS